MPVWHLGGPFGRLVASLERLGDILGRFWSGLKPCWSVQESFSGTARAILGPVKGILGGLGASWERPELDVRGRMSLKWDI